MDELETFEGGPCDVSAVALAILLGGGPDAERATRAADGRGIDGSG
jgi:hypothetical protein